MESKYEEPGQRWVPNLVLKDIFKQIVMYIGTPCTRSECASAYFTAVHPRQFQNICIPMHLRIFGQIGKVWGLK